MRDDSLLKLEKKLDTYSTKDILLSKFVLKPKMDKTEIIQGKDLLTNIRSFISEFKKQNSELLNDENKAKELNIEEGAELAQNNTRRKKSKKNRKKANNKNNINTKEDIIKNKNKKDEKFIELNLKLGILDLIKKQDKNNNGFNSKRKVLIEEIITDKKNHNYDPKENKEDTNSDDIIESSVSCKNRYNQDLNFLRVSYNKNNFNNYTFKGKTNYLDVLKRNDDIFQSITNNKSNCGDSIGEGVKEFEQNPLIDFKNDAFNREVLNFLKENSKNKFDEEVVESKKMKRKILSSVRKNKIINKNNFDNVNNIN